MSASCTSGGAGGDDPVSRRDLMRVALGSFGAMLVGRLPGGDGVTLPVPLDRSGWRVESWTELTTVWWPVAYHPQGLVRSLWGRVNDARLGGYPAGHLLFYGAATHRAVGVDGRAVLRFRCVFWAWGRSWATVLLGGVPLFRAVDFGGLPGGGGVLDGATAVEMTRAVMVLPGVTFAGPDQEVR